jgi:hypothetical protein
MPKPLSEDTKCTLAFFGLVAFYSALLVGFIYINH